MSNANHMIVSKEMHDVLSPLLLQASERDLSQTVTTVNQGSGDKFLPLLPVGKTYKSDGNGNIIVVDDPDYMTEEGTFRKHRKKNMNYTPPKKKRKKNKKHIDDEKNCIRIERRRRNSITQGPTGTKLETGRGEPAGTCSGVRTLSEMFHTPRHRHERVV